MFCIHLLKRWMRIVTNRCELRVEKRCSVPDIARNDFTQRRRQHRLGVIVGQLCRNTVLPTKRRLQLFVGHPLGACGLVLRDDDFPVGVEVNAPARH